MIVRTLDDVTSAVLKEITRADDPRLVEILSALVRHLHGFAREVRLTEAEFQKAIGFIVELGQKTTASHNEAVLVTGSLGLSTLVCLMNNNGDGSIQTTANLLGPFWRMNAPMMTSGQSIVRSDTPGAPLFSEIQVTDSKGRPISGATVDVWHASPEGYYENQDPSQADMNLRGRFVTDGSGRFSFRSVMPDGYPIPINGPAGALAKALRRHNMRPAHVHFLVQKPGFKTHISQVYVSNDPNIETDVQFGVTEPLLGDFVRHMDGKPEGFATDEIEGVWYSLEFTLVLAEGESTLPHAPITGKATDVRPRLEKLERR